jgi:thiol:disulfide interchange protein
MVEIKKLLGFLMLFGCVYFASPFLVRYQMLALCSAVFFSAFVYYAYSAKNERIMYLIQSSGNSEGLKHSVLGSFSIRVLIKTLLSLAALAATVYLGYIAYLVYCKITTIKLIAKFFLK